MVKKNGFLLIISLLLFFSVQLPAQQGSRDTLLYTGNVHRNSTSLQLPSDSTRKLCISPFIEPGDNVLCIISKLNKINKYNNFIKYT